MSVISYYRLLIQTSKPCNKICIQLDSSRLVGDTKYRENTRTSDIFTWNYTELVLTTRSRMPHECRTNSRTNLGHNFPGVHIHVRQLCVTIEKSGSFKYEASPESSNHFVIRWTLEKKGRSCWIRTPTWMRTRLTL